MYTIIHQGCGVVLPRCTTIAEFETAMYAIGAAEANYPVPACVAQDGITFEDEYVPNSHHANRLVIHQYLNRG